MNWSAPVIWAVSGLALLVLEALHPATILLFFGFGALLTAGFTWLTGCTVEWQILVFSAASVLSLVALRRTLRTIFHGRSTAPDAELARLDSLVGEAAVVTEPIRPGASGRVKLRGSFYSATADTALDAGASVVVVADPRQDHTLVHVAPNP